MKLIIPIAVISLTIIVYANINYSDGITGTTLRDGGSGCNCHSSNPTATVNVWIEGKDSVYRGDTTQYKLFMTGGPAVEGGFNIASYFGELNSVDASTKVVSGELTHQFPNSFVNDTVSWDFAYVAPNSLAIDTLYSVGNSVNGNGNPAGDQWNFGENFLIHVLERPTNANNDYHTPAKFVLEQNYPNPFNPSTNIRFQIAVSEFISLKVYDILGNEVANLVSEKKPAGSYKISWYAENSPSGVYLYQLKAGHFTETKKMILLK